MGLVPYVQLARLDRPIGWWLLLLPCWWSLTLAGVRDATLPTVWSCLLFLVGAIVMRGAGCVWNDITDRRIDAQVERTRLRPLAAGVVRPMQALVFMALLCLTGLGVLMQFNGYTVILGLASVGLVGIYPFMKRITWWPQLFLGLAFSWGALMGWASVHARLDPPALLLYVACVFWVMGYDTLYAHQDREDDALIGVHSTARLFGTRYSRMAIGGFYGLAVICLGWAVWLSGGRLWALAGVCGFALHLGWQTLKLETARPDVCLRLFQSNRTAGLLLLAGLCAEILLR